LRAPDRFSRFLRSGRGTTSRSVVTYGDPWITAANPPTSTYRTSCFARISRIRCGRNSGPDTRERLAAGSREAKGGHVLSHPRLRIEVQVRTGNRPIGIVGLDECDTKLQPACLDEPNHPIEGRFGHSRFDASDRRLADLGQ